MLVHYSMPPPPLSIYHRPHFSLLTYVGCSKELLEKMCQSRRDLSFWKDALTAVCIHSTVGCRDWLFKKETSCFHKSHWTLRGSIGLRGGLLWWYRSLMGTADNTHYPSPSIPGILQPPVLWATGRNRCCRNTGRETWPLQLLHLMILKAISFCPLVYLVNFGIDGQYVWGHSQGCFNCILYDSKHLALLNMVGCKRVKFYGSRTICWKPQCVCSFWWGNILLSVTCWCVFICLWRTV